MSMLPWHAFEPCLWNRSKRTRRPIGHHEQNRSKTCSRRRHPPQRREQARPRFHTRDVRQLQSTRVDRVFRRGERVHGPRTRARLRLPTALVRLRRGADPRQRLPFQKSPDVRHSDCLRSPRVRCVPRVRSVHVRTVKSRRPRERTTVGACVWPSQ